mgnify:CR=1 FL=1
MDTRFADIARTEVERSGATLVALEDAPGATSVVVMARGRDISVDELESISRSISRRFVQQYGDDALPSFEVASPGLDRVLKTPYELGLFAGRLVRVVTREAGEPIIGTLGILDEQGLHISEKGIDRVFGLQQIAKVSLWDEILGGAYEG